MKLQKNTIYIIISSILFGIGVIFFSLAITQYQILTSSRATGGSWNQCNADGSNKPCGSCSILNISVDGSGSGKATFGCQLLCEPGNCPTGVYQIDDTSWFWCSGSSGGSCTEGSGDLIANVHNTSSVGSLSISDSNPNATNNSFEWNFSIPNWDGCGRVQVDVKINAQGVNLAGKTESFGDSCSEPTPTTPPDQPTPTTPPPTPTTPPDQPTPTTPPPTPTTPPDQPTPTTPPPTPTNSPSPSPSQTPTPTPTETPTPTPTPTETPTPTPTETPVPTDTPVPSDTPVPTAVIVQDVPTPVVIVDAPTATPVQNLTVNEQAPGFNPIFALLIPFALVLLGLAL